MRAALEGTMPVAFEADSTREIDRALTLARELKLVPIISGGREAPARSVELQAANVPVLAYAAGAVPETLGGAGVLFTPKDLELAAEAMGMLVYDRPFRQSVLEGQRRRLLDFAPGRIEQRLNEVIGQFS